MKATVVLATSMLLGLGSTHFARAQTPDLEACSTPGLTIDADSFDLLDVLTISESQPIADVHVTIDITHTFVGDLTVAIAHDGTSVTLHNGQGGSGDDLRVTYRDAGAPNGSEPYDCECAITPSGPGQLGDFAGQTTEGDWELTVLDNFPGSDDGFLAEWCLRSFQSPPSAPPPPVQNLLCSSMRGTDVAQLFWIPAAAYDGYEIYQEGALIATLPSTATGYTSPPLIVPSINEFSVRAVRAGILSAPRTCFVTLTPTIDVERCANPRSAVSEFLPAVSPILVSESITIGDAQVDIDITHTFVGDLLVDVISPASTTVRLHDGQGFGAQNLRATYWEFGAPHGSQPYDCDCLVQPSGPGTLVDFLGEDSQGVWRVTVVDQFLGDTGVFHGWCLRLFENVPVFPVEDLACEVAGEPGTIEVSWVNPIAYDSVEVTVDGVVDTVVTGPLVAGSTTSVVTSALPFPAPAQVCVRPSISGSQGSAQCCDLFVTLAPVEGLAVDTSSGVAELSWTNPTTYDSIFIVQGGNTLATLPGAATSFTAPAVPIPSTVEYCVVAYRSDFGSSPSACIDAFLLPAADLTECSTPYAPISDLLPPVIDTISIADDESIIDLEVTISITHTFVGDLDVDLTSPAGTMVRLHDQGGTSTDDILAVYSDSGLPGGSVPYDCGCPIQPSGITGAGSLSDFIGESTLGDWTLAVTDNTELDDGELEYWCLRFVDTCNLTPPVDLTCTEDDSNVTLDWTNLDPYSQIEVRRNGVAIATLPGIAESYVDASVAPGDYHYQVRGLGPDCDAPSPTCSIAFGITDVLYRGELAGLVDSVGALAAALDDPTRVIQIATQLDASTVAVGPELRAVWVLLGTYPANHPLTQDEGLFLAELHTGDIGLDGTIDRDPIPVYIEGGDVWGFDAPTAFSAYDGVMESVVFDGDDSLQLLFGQDSLVGLDLSRFGGAYQQDQLGNDYNDQLVSAQVAPDLGGTAVGAVWRGGATAPAYNVGLFYASTVAPVIAQSFEFGGYTGDAAELAAAYASALAGDLPPVEEGDPFVRGDWDQDGLLVIGDPINVLSFIFDPAYDTPPACPDSADANDDGVLTIADAIFLLSYIFGGSDTPPPAPGPSTCGPDPTPDTLPACDYDGCP